MALTGNTMAATVNGYRARAEKVWFPTSGSWVADGSSAGITLSASAPTTTATGSTSSGNKYGQIIKITTPNDASIKSIQSITITFYAYDRNSTKGTLYGSLRTTYTDSGSSDTVAFFRTNAVGSEASISTLTTTNTKVSFTFTGTLSKNTSYYLFLYTKSTSDIYGFNNSYIDTATITYTKNSYTVSYNANGHGTAPSSQTKIYGESLTLQSFIANQTGTGYKVSFNANGGASTPSALTSTLTYTQTEWDTSSAGTGTSYKSAGSYTANSAATLYAIWSTTKGAITLPAAIKHNGVSSTYTVSYNANGGSSTPSDQTLTRKTPKTFSKWAAGSTSGTQYAAGDSYTPSAATTMYAIFTDGSTTGSITLASGISKADSTADGFTVSFNANGGSCSTTSLVVSDTVKHTFSKWNTKANGSGTSYNAGASYSTSADLSLYAIFTSSTTKGSITLPTPTRSGYEFVGWATSSTATTGTTGSYTPDSDITLYAIWKQSYSTVYYNDNGNCVACIVYYNDNGTAVLCNVFYNNNGSAVQI